MSLVGRPAPNFSAMAVMPDGSIKEDFELDPYIRGGIGVVFFYALNFSYLCPLELTALNNALPKFKERGANVVAVGVDSHLSHQWWKLLPRENGGIGQIGFPLISDLTGKIAEGYNVLINESLALRATFIIDRIGVVRYQNVQDLPLGRNIDDILRVIDAQSHHERTGEVTPPNWQRGQQAVVPTQEGLMSYVRQLPKTGS